MYLYTITTDCVNITLSPYPKLQAKAVQLAKRMLLSFISVYLVALLLLTHSAGVTSAGEALKFYAVNYPPYDIATHPAGKRGFDVEVVEAAFAAVNRNIQVKFRPWKRIMSEVQSGKATGAVTCSNVRSRNGWVHLSDELSVTRLAIVVPKSLDTNGIKRVDDLRRYSTVAVNGYASEKELTSLGIDHAKTNTIESALKMLNYRDGIQAFYGGWESTEFVASKMGFQDNLTFLPDTSKFPHPFYVCFSKKWPGIKSIITQFNMGLKTLRSTGQYQSIHSKYK